MGWGGWSSVRDAVNPVSHIKSLTTNPQGGVDNYLKRAFMGAEPSGLTTRLFDQATGGDGSFNSAANNRYLQMIGGGVLGYFTGNPFIGMGVGALGAVIGGGNMEDAKRGAMYGGLGSGLGSYASGFGWAGSPASRATPPPVQPTAVDPTPTRYSLANSTPNTDTPVFSYDGMTGDTTQIGMSSPVNASNYSLVPENGAEGMVQYGTIGGTGNIGGPGAMEGMGTYTPAAGATGSAAGDMVAPTSMTSSPRAARPVGGSMFPGAGGGGGTNWGMRAAMGAKAGLGFWQNYQQQKALEDELKDRERIRNMQLAAMNDPMSVPGMRAQRDLGRRDFDARFRARYGYGGEGGAYDKGMARYMDSVTSAGVGNYVNTLGGIGAQTQPAMMMNAQAGGTPSGAAAGALSSGLSDYMLMQWWANAMGGQ